MEPLPGFDGATGWLNSPPLTAADLRRRAVLVDFWTFTCINWLRTEPYIRVWSRAYRTGARVLPGSARVDPVPRAPRRRHARLVTRDRHRRGRNGLLRDARLYQLVRQRGTVCDRTLTISFADRGAEAYVFTFG